VLTAMCTDSAGSGRPREQHQLWDSPDPTAAAAVSGVNPPAEITAPLNTCGLQKGCTGRWLIDCLGSPSNPGYQQAQDSAQLVSQNYTLQMLSLPPGRAAG